MGFILAGVQSSGLLLLAIGINGNADVAGRTALGNSLANFATTQYCVGVLYCSYILLLYYSEYYYKS
jgi:hypothetical protein